MAAAKEITTSFSLRPSMIPSMCWMPIPTAVPTVLRYGTLLNLMRANEGPNATKIFISYAHADGTALAQRLVRDLTADGLEPWLDDHAFMVLYPPQAKI